MKDIEDILLKLYELNEHYHDTKDNMAWLGISLYAAFSLAILRIFFTKEIRVFINDCPVIIIIVFLLVIYFCAFWFINVQYKKKRISVGISTEYMKILSNQKLSDKLKLKHMFKIIKVINYYWCMYKKKHRKKNKHKNKYILTEVPINILIVAFLVSQILVILYLKNWIWK